MQVVGPKGPNRCVVLRAWGSEKWIEIECMSSLGEPYKKGSVKNTERNNVNYHCWSRHWHNRKSFVFMWRKIMKIEEGGWKMEEDGGKWSVEKKVIRAGQIVGRGQETHNWPQEKKHWAQLTLNINLQHILNHIMSMYRHRYAASRTICAVGENISFQFVWF